MIEIRNLTKKFGNLTAIDGLSFMVDEGEVFSFLGPNCVGKTTGAIHDTASFRASNEASG